MTDMETELTALMIAPNRALAEQFQQAVAPTRSFQILADLKTYPPLPALDVRMRQLQPDVVLLDLSTDLGSAGELIRAITSNHPSVHVIGLHTTNDSEAILRSLRLGAAEFLYSPFDAEAQREALARIQRIRQPESAARAKPGTVVMFSSTKPGSGASTLATQTAFALKKLTSKRVLLADFDLMAGTVAFYLKLRARNSLLDALRYSDRLDPLRWNSLVQQSQGLEVLPAPEIPGGDTIEPNRLQDVLEYARVLYDWVVVDLPGIFQGISLLAVSHSDRALLISTSELPSLHLTRKAVTFLDQLGFGKDRFQVVVNRVGEREGIRKEDMGTILNCSAGTILPNDYFSLHRAITLGQALGTDCALGKSIEQFASRLAGIPPKHSARAGLWRKSKPRPSAVEGLEEMHAVDR
jgi:pilus assembly protein CpaE